MNLVIKCVVIVIPLCSAITIQHSSKHNSNITVSDNLDKRSAAVGDLSYSYSATDIESSKGSHIKTITVIKNVGAPHAEHKLNGNEERARDWTENQFKFFVKVPELSDISALDIFNGKPKVSKENDDKLSTSSKFSPKDESDSAEFQTEPNLKVPMFEVSDIGKLSESMGYKSNDQKQIMDSMEKGGVELIQLEPLSDNHPSNEKSARFILQHKISSNQSPTYIEDFSHYSLHNVQHLSDHQKKQQLESLATKSDKDKSQPYIDGFHSSFNTKPYLAPTIERTLVSTSTHRPQPIQKSLVSRVKFTNIGFQSTTQQPYIAPKSKLSSSSMQISYKTIDSTHSISPEILNNVYKGYKIENLTKLLPMAQKVTNIYEDDGPKKKHESFSSDPLNVSASVSNKKEKLIGSIKSELPAHLKRHQYVFDSKPPYSFLESPFQSSFKTFDYKF